MSLSKVFDAATPPATAPAGCTGVLGYVGKPGFTPHVWTPDEWRRFSGHGEFRRRQFPAYVPDLAADPAAEARIALAAVEALGWAPNLPEPRTRAIVCDLEISIAPAWYQRFAAEINASGYVSVAYGSLSSIAANLASDLWVASWDGDPVLEPGQTIRAHQYQSGPGVDLSVVDEWLFERGGIGPRHG